MKISIVLISFLAVFLSGCATTETVKEAKGQGASRTYQYAMETVYSAALAAAKTKGLEVVENDKANGKLMLSHGTTLMSWGEKIAVFVKPVATNSTEVEVVSKPVMSTLNFPPDWQTILLDQIEIELRATK